MMKHVLFNLIIIFFVASGVAQTVVPMPDSGFNLSAAYLQASKKFAATQKVSAVDFEQQVHQRLNVPYCNDAKRNLTLDAFFPKSASGKRVAIVLVHGGGWSGGSADMYHTLAMALASRGYVCITPSYRLSSEALYPAAVQDIQAVVRFLKSKGTGWGIDTGKIVLAGHSAGGQLAALCANAPDVSPFTDKRCHAGISARVHALISMDGILSFLHPESGEGNDAVRISSATRWFGVAKTENAALWEQASVLNYAGAHSPPSLFINSGITRMHAGRDDYIRMLAMYAIPYQVKAFSNAPHTFCLFNPWFDSTVAVIDFFIQDIFGPDAGKLSSQIKGSTVYRNPVLHADFSDPDAIRVGKDYYMIASSFNHVPGLPILHSVDLVHWNLTGHALQALEPFGHYTKVQHGGGVWAPAIRYHKDSFFIYFPDPDFGIYVTKAAAIGGPWTKPVLVQAGKGLIDPCPLWDDDGKVYLVHAYAGSRAGIKSVLVVKPMNETGTEVTGPGVLVYDGHGTDPTVEGPKFYKKDGWYYIFAPAGGVATGWQIVLRSKNVYGPYERKMVMAQGKSAVNGPHQGAWVQTDKGEDWFLHFQDKEAYGRVVHLQPMQWKNGWPVIGQDADQDGIGTPVDSFRMPLTSGKSLPALYPYNDEFNTERMSPQWQWHANVTDDRWFMYRGHLRMYAQYQPQQAAGLWNHTGIIMQKFPAASFSATIKMKCTFNQIGERAGMVVFGTDYYTVFAEKTEQGIVLGYGSCLKADKAGVPVDTITAIVPSGYFFLQIRVTRDATCSLWYSADGIHYSKLGASFKPSPGKWVGARIGLYGTSVRSTNDAGFADVDWYRVAVE